MIRKIDKQGRVALPPWYMRELDIKDEVDIILKTNQIIIKKPIWGCVFCGAATKLIRIRDMDVCRNCINRMYDSKDNDILYITKTD